MIQGSTMARKGAYYGRELSIIKCVFYSLNRSYTHVNGRSYVTFEYWEPEFHREYVVELLKKIGFFTRIPPGDRDPRWKSYSKAKTKEYLYVTKFDIKKLPYYEERRELYHTENDRLIYRSYDWYNRDIEQDLKIIIAEHKKYEQSLPPPAQEDSNNFAEQEDSNNFTEKEDSNNFTEKEDSNNFTEKEDLNIFTTEQEDLNIFTTEQEDLNIFTTEQEGKKMSKIQAMSKKALEQNKKAFKLAARLQAGEIALVQFKNMVLKKVPMLSVFADEPWMDIVIANMAGLALQQVSSPKAEIISDSLIQYATYQMLKSFNITQMINEILSGIDTSMIGDVSQEIVIEPEND